MPSPSISSSPRRPIHRRVLDVQIYAREDGLYELEARLIDTKNRDVPLAGVLRKAGDPIHEMVLHLVVDTQLNIREAASETLWMPYPAACGEHGDAYAQLVGLNLMKGFRLGVKERLAGIKGCTHLTELCGVLPTAVIQAFAGVVIDTREGDTATGTPPFQIDKCHALRSDGAMVETHYPRWYRKTAPDALSAAAPAASS